jgi:hypothetical protein
MDGWQSRTLSGEVVVGTRWRWAATVCLFTTQMRKMLLIKALCQSIYWQSCVIWMTNSLRFLRNLVKIDIRGWSDRPVLANGKKSWPESVRLVRSFVFGCPEGRPDLD